MFDIYQKKLTKIMFQRNKLHNGISNMKLPLKKRTNK
jgi:hypothetical protein